MKFQDTQELMAQDVADAIQQMHEKGRYRELLLVVETCQAATLYSKIRWVWMSVPGASAGVSPWHVAPHVRSDLSFCCQVACH